MRRRGYTIAIRSVPVLACVLAILVAGCAYESVKIFVGNNAYEGNIESHWEDVEVSPSGILLKPGARFSVKIPTVTQFMAQFEAAIVSGNGMTVYLRNVTHNFNPQSGIAFRYAVDGCSMRLPDGTVIPLEYNAETDQQFLQFLDEAHRLSINVGCDNVYEGNIDLEATEYIIFETLPESTVELRSVRYFDIPGD